MVLYLINQLNFHGFSGLQLSQISEAKFLLRLPIFLHWPHQTLAQVVVVADGIQELAAPEELAVDPERLGVQVGQEGQEVQCTN